MKKQSIISIILAAVLSMAFLGGCGKSTPTAEQSSPKSLPPVSAVETVKESSAEKQGEAEGSTESKPESSTESKPESKPESSAESSAESSTEISTESSAESSTESKPEPSTEESSETHSEPVSEPEPSIQEQSAEQSSVPQQSSSKPEASSKPEPKEIKVTNIRLSRSSITMYEGGLFKLDCYIEPEDATDHSFKWMWSDASVIDMESNGRITALKPGVVTITAKTPDGKTAECVVTVKERSQNPGELTGAVVDESWFDDAVFVGDSVTNALSNYSDNGWLGDAEFICSVGIGYHSALWDINREGNLHPVFNGKKVTIEDAVSLVERNKVFIMLGMNDLGTYTPQGAVDNMLMLCSRILEKNPGVQIYIESITPLLEEMDNKSSLNNANISEYNRLAAQACKEHGFIFVNVAEAVMDDKGNLTKSLCLDPNYMGLHLNYAGCEVWVDYLKSHVA